MLSRSRHHKYRRAVPRPCDDGLLRAWYERCGRGTLVMYGASVGVGASISIESGHVSSRAGRTSSARRTSCTRPFLRSCRPSSSWLLLLRENPRERRRDGTRGPQYVRRRWWWLVWRVSRSAAPIVASAPRTQLSGPAARCHAPRAAGFESKQQLYELQDRLFFAAQPSSTGELEISGQLACT